MAEAQAPLWYKDAVFYGLDIEKFQDSNGDGIGDFPGLTSRLDYLADLGVTCLWLLPFFPSPNGDNGYDVSDYYGVDPKYGSFDDFLACVRKAGERGLRVMIDLVMDHSSDQHPWFRAARRDRHSRYRRYYFWSDAPPPPEPGQGNIFPGEESSVWTYDEVAGQYYYHQFYKFEPDLNVGSPDVQEEIKRVIDFWLSFGIAGFRVDAVSHMIDGPDVGDAAASHDPHQILRDMRAFTSGRRAHAALLGEADVAPEELKQYFGRGDELHLLYNFLLNQYLFLGLASRRGDAIRQALRLLPSIPESGQWANFLRNLDELDLERLSEEDRALVLEEFAPDSDMRIFGRGIRRRLAPMLKDRRRIDMAMSLLFSLPGAPLLIYGDEIGMGEDLSLEGRHAVRTPMQWSPELNGGFSTAAPDAVVTPVISEGPFDYRRVNVQDQAKDPGSLLNWMKRLIAVRRQCPEWGWGAMRIIETDEPGIFAHECDWKGSRLLALHNLAEKPCSIRLPRERDLTFHPLLGTIPSDPSRQSSLVEMDAYGFLWLRLVPGHG